MSRFNFNEITRNNVADILEVDENFKRIEENGALIDDLPKSRLITIASSEWVNMQDYFQYTIQDSLIKPEPYNIKIIFTDLDLIKSSIYPKANSQSDGRIILKTHKKPEIDLNAILLITKGVNV